MVTEGEFDPDGFGERLRSAIARADTSQSKLAERIDQPRSRISEWVRGERVPKLKDAIAIASELQVSLDWLATGAEPPTTAERALVDELAGLAPSLLPIVSRASLLAGK